MKEETKPPVDEGPKLKRIDMSQPKFQANGHTYYIQSNLSLERYVEYLKLSNELAFNTDFEGVFKTLKQVHAAVTSGNDVLSAIQKTTELTYNQMNAIVDFANRDHPTVLRFCALFINREDEEIHTYDERLIDPDWTEEGLAIDDFFYLAANFIPSFRDTFRSLSLKEEQEGKPQKQTLPDTDSTSTNSSSSSESETDPSS